VIPGPAVTIGATTARSRLARTSAACASAQPACFRACQKRAICSKVISAALAAVGDAGLMPRAICSRAWSRCWRAASNEISG